MISEFSRVSELLDAFLVFFGWVAHSVSGYILMCTTRSPLGSLWKYRRAIRTCSGSVVDASFSCQKAAELWKQRFFCQELEVAALLLGNIVNRECLNFWMHSWYFSRIGAILGIVCSNMLFNL